MINPTETNENHYDHGEEKICKEFGCGRKLTLRESLFGDRCIKHSYENKSNPVDLQYSEIEIEEGKIHFSDPQPAFDFYSYD